MNQIIRQPRTVTAEHESELERRIRHLEAEVARLATDLSTSNKQRLDAQNKHNRLFVEMRHIFGIPDAVSFEHFGKWIQQAMEVRQARPNAESPAIECEVLKIE